MLNQQYQYRFLDIVIRKGEIAIWNKMRVASSQKLFRKKYTLDENPQVIAEKFVDEYWQEQLNLDDADLNVIKGLQQSHDLKAIFIKDMFDLAAKYQREWMQDVYFRFGITGNLAEGKLGKPNYQIQSADAQHRLIFQYSGVELVRDGHELQAFAEENLSRAFSIAELKQIWLVY